MLACTPYTHRSPGSCSCNLLQIVASSAAPTTHLVVVHACAQRSEEVDGLPREGVHQLLHLLAVEVVLVEDAHAHAHAVLTGGVPVVLLHAPITDEGSIQGGEVVTCREGRIRVQQQQQGWREVAMEEDKMRNPVAST
jgi:hypothetical protein